MKTKFGIVGCGFLGNIVANAWKNGLLEDYELVGVPFGLVVGRSLADGQVEIRVRATGETIVVPVEEAVARLRELHGAALKGE